MVVMVARGRVDVAEHIVVRRVGRLASLNGNCSLPRQLRHGIVKRALAADDRFPTVVIVMTTVSLGQ